MDITLPDAELDQESSPVDTTRQVIDTPADSPSKPSTDPPCHVATIPTSNSFAILDIQEPIISLEQPEPVQSEPQSVPEPKEVRPVPKPRKRLPTTTDSTLPTVPPPQSPTAPS